MAQTSTVSRIGWVTSSLVVLALLADSGTQLFAPHLLKAEMAATGFDQTLATPLGIIMLTCGLLYAIPRTAVLGAILTTAFLGGAICAHFRLGEFASPPEIICVLLGVLTWGGLYLRDPRVRALIPLTTRIA